MAPRVSSDLLLVGSLPVATSEEGLRAGGKLFGDLVFALPDGETGERAAWVGDERTRLFMPHPDVELLDRPTEGSGGHVYDAPALRVRSGVSMLRFDDWSRIDEALESYCIFRVLREEELIPDGMRFQVSLPFPASAITVGFRTRLDTDYPVLEAAYEDLVHRGIGRLLEEIPATDLAIQWDICYETLDLEGVLPWTDQSGAWERFTGPSQRLSRLVPEETVLGYHLCYGTFPEWPMYETKDLGLLVKMANIAVQTSGRPVDWIHMAGPRHLRSEEDAFFRPLANLDAPDTRVYLGLVLPLDGVDGLLRRVTTARRHLDDFGVAMYCGFGRQPGEDGQTTMRNHRESVLSVVG